MRDEGPLYGDRLLEKKRELERERLRGEYLKAVAERQRFCDELLAMWTLGDYPEPFNVKPDVVV